MPLPGAILHDTAKGITSIVSCPCGTDINLKGYGFHGRCPRCSRLHFLGNPDDVRDGTCPNPQMRRNAEQAADDAALVAAHRAKFRNCPYCTTEIARAAVRCPHCMSWFIPIPFNQPGAE